MNRNIKYISSFLVAIFLALGAVFLLQPIAKAKPATAPTPETAPATSPATQATTKPSNIDKSSATQPTSKQVMQRLLTHRPPSPPIEPEHSKDSRQNIKKLTKQSKINANILGIAPDETLPKLLPEGAFIVSRRGRVRKSPDGFHDIFVFEADSKDNPETPMILLPSKNLENMEDMVKDNNSPLFIVSGQVHVYRGANYLMLTTFKVVKNRGNLNLRGH